MSTAATSGKGPASAPAAGTPTSPSPRATGSSAAGATAPRPASTSQRIAIPGADLEFDLPADWQRQGEAWAWQTAGSETARLGVAWRDTQPGTEIEAMLPAQSVVKNRTPGPAELSWGTAATYLVQVMRPASQGQTQAWEQHVLVRHGGRSYDLYESGKDEAELAAMEPAFRMMLASSRAK